MADPIIEDGLVLVSTYIKHDNSPQVAMVTWAIFDNTAENDAPTWAGLAQGMFAGAWSGGLDNQAVITHSTVVLGDGTSTFTQGESTAAGTRGLNAIDSQPSQVAALIRKRTSFGGRANRGRSYIPWSISDEDADSVGALTSGKVTDLQAAADDWLTSVKNGSVFYMVIANRTYDLPWDNPNRVVTLITGGPEVTSMQADSLVATQRRRLGR